MPGYGPIGSYPIMAPDALGTVITQVVAFIPADERRIVRIVVEGRGVTVDYEARHVSKNGL